MAAKTFLCKRVQRVYKATQWNNPGDHPKVKQYDPSKAGNRPRGWFAKGDIAHIIHSGEWIVETEDGKIVDSFSDLEFRREFERQPETEETTPPVANWSDMAILLSVGSLTLVKEEDGNHRLNLYPGPEVSFFWSESHSCLETLFKLMVNRCKRHGYIK